MKTDSFFLLSHPVMLAAIATVSISPAAQSYVTPDREHLTSQFVEQNIAQIPELGDATADQQNTPPSGTTPQPLETTTDPPILDRDLLPDTYWDEINPFQRVLSEPGGTTINNALPVFTPTGLPNFSSPSPSSPSFVNNGVLPSPEILDAEYRLGAGDTIQLEFFNTPEYNGQFAIDPTGSITAPLVGRVVLRDLTIAGAGDRLAEVYASELRYPDVDVILINRRPLQVVFSGEITQPGLYTFPSNTNGQAPKLYQALQNAGGITAAGDIERIQVIRDSTDPTLSHTVSINLLALLNQGDLNQNIDLRDGDVVNIPSAPIINTDTINQLALSNARSQSTLPVDVAVLGEVGLPGPYRFGAGDQTTLVRAIQQAGGLTPFADVHEVTLERTTRTGNIQKITIDLFTILESGRIDQDVALQTGDVIQIPATELPNSEVTAIASSTLSTGPIEVAILGEVERPGGLQVRANTSLNQAILAAGGFNGLARKKVKLLSFNPDGSVTERTIDVDLNRTINAEDNPILRPNDIVMVGKSTWGSIKDAIGSFSSNLNFFLPFLFFLSDPQL
ncbi:polysaccharide export protein [[Leptolyngbya] sp. PCC 7376]|uniref:SLBB domain-containing protein n=1 Tax=[Leptolyngbya] sp. PCC 7376 TaxID=111781 RepID=UPI00029EFB2E|nr:SLBB domain-containing protein [[Leptolyngbya] sp. PCC 7376]AFY37964.1 polysaccharide export protein [[Leptolyngbya] sp. PCC 7376]